MEIYVFQEKETPKRIIGKCHEIIHQQMSSLVYSLHRDLFINSNTRIICAIFNYKSRMSVD